MKKRLRKDGVAGDARRARRSARDGRALRSATLEKAVHDYAERSGRKMGDVVNPLRVAVTGQGVGPGPLRLPGHPGPRRLPSRIAQTLEMLASRLDDLD